RMNTSHQDYYRVLLKKYEYNNPDYEFTFIAEPRVVLNRYILMASCIPTPGSKRYCFEPYSFESLCRKTFRFCPHSQLRRSADPAEYPFAAAVRQAFHSLSDQQDPRPRFFSYDQCPTDISFLVKKDETYIVSWP